MIFHYFGRAWETRTQINMNKTPGWAVVRVWNSEHTKPCNLVSKNEWYVRLFLLSVSVFGIIQYNNYMGNNDKNITVTQESYGHPSLLVQESAMR